MSIIDTLIGVLFNIMGTINGIVGGILIRAISDAIVTPFFNQLGQSLGTPTAM